MRQISVHQLRNRLQESNEKPLLLDVREAWEVRLCALDDSVNIPMSHIAARLNELDPERETIVICHHGVRSYQVAYFLEHQGFQNLTNLQGGIDAWAREIDPAMAKY